MSEMTMVPSQQGPLVQMELFKVVDEQNERQKSQGKTIDSMIVSMKVMYQDFTTKFAQVEGMVQEVRDSVTMTDKECYDLQASVFAKSTALTKDRYAEADGNFKDVVGKYRRLIWSKVKGRFAVAKYSHIRRIDFADAINFIQTFCPEDHI